MSFLGRLWAHIKLFFVAAAPPQIPERFDAPPAAEDVEEKFGPFQKLEAQESTHVVGMRNPKMTGRTSATHPPRKGVMLTQASTPAIEARRRSEDLVDRVAHRRALHDGSPMIECLRCGGLYPTADIADHPCDGAPTIPRISHGGSASFDTAMDNVVYFDPKLNAKGTREP